MKIIVLVVLFVFTGVSYYLLIDHDQGTVELTHGVIKTPLSQENSAGYNKTISPTTSSSSVLGTSMTDLQSADHKVLTEQLNTSQSLRSQSQLSDDMIGRYDPSAIAPEDESVQTLYTDVMEVSVSSGIAPESGNEMMPISNDIPLISEQIDDSKAPELLQ